MAIYFLHFWINWGHLVRSMGIFCVWKPSQSSTNIKGTELSKSFLCTTVNLTICQGWGIICRGKCSSEKDLKWQKGSTLKRGVFINTLSGIDGHTHWLQLGLLYPSDWNSTLSQQYPSLLNYKCKWECHVVIFYFQTFILFFRMDSYPPFLTWQCS